MSLIRFWAMTVGMTILVWFAADQSVTRSVQVQMPIDIRPAVVDSMKITVDEASRGPVELEFRGPNRAISEFREIKDTLRPRIEIAERDSGKYQLDLVEELRKHMDRFPDGLAVVKATPPTVSIAVDRFVSRDVRLEIDAGDLELTSFELVPDVVVATVPQQQFDALPPAERVITIGVESMLANVIEGETSRHDIAVPLTIGSFSAHAVRPQKVTFTARLFRRTKTVSIKTVPVGVMYSAINLTENRVHFSDQDDALVTVELRISGPVDKIEDIERDPIGYIDAYIRITREDIERNLKPGESIPKTPVIRLPEGIELVQLPDDINIQLHKEN